MSKTQGYLTNTKFSLVITEDGEAIAAITPAKPAVVKTSLDVATNDVVVITGATPERVNGMYMVKTSGNEANKEIMLLGKDGDFTGLSDIKLDKAKIAKVPMSSYCQAKSINVTLYQIEEEDETTLCDEEAQTETKVKPGSCSLDNFYRDNSEMTERLRLAAENSEEIFIQMQHGAGGRIRGWRAKVTKFDYSAQVGSKMTNAIDFKFNTFPIEAGK